jgi:ribose transport system ATP-binding protein
MADALIAQSITHTFGGAKALDDVTFEVRAGEVHALLGENGAGKSTLVKVITGALFPDSGDIFINGTVHRFRNPRQAQEQGIGVVYQDFHLFPHLTVAENIFSAAVKMPSRAGLSARSVMYAEARELLASFGIDVDPRRRVGSLDAAERKLIEISRALLRNPHYLILDEPTAALEPRETVRLLGVIDRLRQHGTGVILVTHRLGEVAEIADRATALRNGRNVGTMDRVDFSLESLAHLIVGQEVVNEQGPVHLPGEPVLKMSNLRVRSESVPVEITVGRGELVAVIGLIGSGVSTVMNAACGAIPSHGAEVEVNGKPHRFRDRRAAQALGIGAVPIDRKASGLILGASVAKNIGLANLREYATAGFSSRRKLRDVATRNQQLFDIRLQSVDQPVSSLSGGNQQKVMLGRWEANGSQILVIQEPTQGVDIGARQEIHRYLIEYAEKGGAVLFSSSDLEEVRVLAHRIYVMHAGEVVDVISNTGTDRPSRRTLTTAMAAGSLADAEKEVWT